MRTLYLIYGIIIVLLLAYANKEGWVLGGANQESRAAMQGGIHHK